MFSKWPGYLLVGVLFMFCGCILCIIQSGTGVSVLGGFGRIRVNSASGQVGPGHLDRVNSAGSSRPYIKSYG